MSKAAQAQISQVNLEDMLPPRISEAQADMPRIGGFASHNGHSAHNGHAAPADSADSTAPVAKPAQSTNPAEDADVSIEHWNELFSSVKARLRRTVDEHLVALTLPLADVAAEQVRTRVLECVSALDQLHNTLTHEADRRQRLELELFEARSALAQARSEIVGTRADELRARHLAFHDGLTLLPNRSFFRQRLEQALDERGQAPGPILAVLYLDLDGFKPINDEHGHETGDELLKIVAARLTRTVRAEDMVSRVGGDEFACLLGGVPTRDQMTELARKLFHAIAATVQIGDVRLKVRPSIGIALCPTDGVSADALLKTADAAMYRAKRRQTGHAFFDELSEESKFDVALDTDGVVPSRLSN